MSDFFMGVTINRVAEGLWNVTIIFYLDVADDDHRMRANGWAELVEFGIFGEEIILVPLRDVPEIGSLVYSGLWGGENIVGAKRKLRVVAHYQAEGQPQYLTKKDFYLGSEVAEEGEQHATEVIPASLAPVYGDLTVQAKNYARKTGLVKIV